MRKRQEALQAAIEPVTELLGPLSLQLLTVSPIAEIGRLAVLVNFFTGPLYKELDERIGISRIGFVVLHCLFCSPPTGLLAQDIARATGYPKNSISRAISELSAAGYLERHATSDDKRAKTLLLTEKGAALLKDILPVVGRRQEKMFSALTPEERTALDMLTSRMIAKLPEWVGADDLWD